MGVKYNHIDLPLSTKIATNYIRAGARMMMIMTIMMVVAMASR